MSRAMKVEIMRIAVSANLLIVSLGCSAESVVLASSAPQYPVGYVVSGKDSVTLASGQSISLLTSEGQRLELKGEYTGPAVDEVARGDGSGLVEALASLLERPAPDRSVMGVTRSVGGEPANPAQASPGDSGSDPHTLVVSPEHSGRYCVAPWQRVVIAKPADGIAYHLKLTDTSSGHSETLFFGAKGGATAWPASMPVTKGLTVEARRGLAGEAMQLEFSPVAMEPTDPGLTAVRLVEADCLDQAKPLLEALQKDAASRL